MQVRLRAAQNFWRTAVRRLIQPSQTPKSTRSVAIELHENANAIEAWRMTLPERQRKRLIHPLSNVRRWRTSLGRNTGKCPQDLKREAAAAWRRFVSCVQALPSDQAHMLWQAASAEIGRAHV